MKIKNFHFASALLLLVLLAASASATSYTLSVTAQGSGTITTNPTFATYPANVTVSLTAIPATGWYFANWSGAVNATTNPVNVIMTGNLSVTGQFLAYPTYSLSLNTNGQGSITLSPAGGNYYSNTVVTAMATPAAGWVFTGWSGATNTTTSPVALTLNSNLALTGNFVQLPAFDVQPQSVTNVLGSTVSFTSHSVGTAPVAYQWYFSNNPLVGATNPGLTLTNANGGVAGSYQVIATNLYGSATSSVVALVLTNGSQSTNVVSVCDEASLRAAIAAGGWVSIGCSSTITLAGPINITKNVVLDGSGVSATISGGGAVQLFNVAPGIRFSLTNLTLVNGSSIVTNGTAIAAGGAIYNNAGIVTLTGCMLTNNIAIANISAGIAEGGAIYNNGGAINLYVTTLAGNVAFGGRQNYAGSGTTGPALGGALFNTNGTMVIANSLLQGNLCTNYGLGTNACFGGAVFQGSGALYITNTILSGNQALGSAPYPYSSSGRFISPAYGGALAAIGGTASMDLCQWVGNTAKGGDSPYHAPGSPAFGGAVYCSNVLKSVRCSFSANQALGGNYAIGGINYANTAAAASGGAIYNFGSAIFVSCQVSSNFATGGFSTVSAGAAPGGDASGGGIFNGASLRATNCTIALNGAFGGQGVEGLFASGGIPGTNGNAVGGGLFNASNAAFLGVNVTIASNFCNSVAPGGSLTMGQVPYVNGFAAGSEIANTNGTVSLLNSLVAYGSTNGNAYGVIVDLGDNISDDGTASFSSGSSFNLTDPLLGPLANNGGPTLTMALLPDSPAIGYADSGNGAPPDDQRGFARPTGSGVIDLGAYQSGATQIYTPPPTLSLNIARVFPNIVVSFTTVPAITNTIHLQVSTNLINWVDLQTIGAYASPSNISQTISPQGAAAKFFRLMW